MTQFTAGPLTGYTWAAVMAAAAACALALMAFRGRNGRLKPGTVPLFGLLAVPLCVLAGRAGYWLCSINRMRVIGEGFLDLKSGGLMFYGALCGGLLAAFLTGKITRTPFGRVLDCAAAPAALMIAAGRFAEYLTGAGYGFSVADWFDPWNTYGRSFIAWENPEILCRFPFAVSDGFYGDWLFAINLWEGLAAVVFLIILLRLKPRRDGGAGALLIMMYAACQIVFESMREDEVLRLNFMKISQLLSAVALLVLLIICLRMAKAGTKETVLSLIVMLALAGVATAMEFALEQKIGFLTWMRADLCYLVMALCSGGMLAVTCRAWKKAFPRVQDIRQN